MSSPQGTSAVVPRAWWPSVQATAPAASPSAERTARTCRRRLPIAWCRASPPLIQKSRFTPEAPPPPASTLSSSEAITPPSDKEEHLGPRVLVFAEDLEAAGLQLPVDGAAGIV